MFKNLIFEGGGIKGIAFCGAVKVLEELDEFKNITSIAGSSAGAIVAVALAVGYNSSEIEFILKETNFNNFKDDSWGYTFDIIRLIRKYGVYKGDKFYEWLGNVLHKKTNNADITFEEIYNQYKINLVITGTNLNKRKTIYFNYKDYPNMTVRLAVRISMSLPFIFQSVTFNDDIYIDGGVLDNYPIWYFEKINESLGFKLCGSEECRDNEIYHNNNKINNLIDFGKNILDALFNQIEKLNVKDEYWNHTITINSLDINTTDFDISDKQKNLLIEEGYKATKSFFEKYKKNDLVQ